jgi:beta-galactosidase
VNRLGAGSASYLSAHIDRASIGAMVERFLERAAVPFRAADGIETSRRATTTSSWLFAFNHGDGDTELDAAGFDLIAGQPFDGILAAGQVTVVRESQPEVST